MSLWLQPDQASRLPPYASHQVGACGKVCACPYFGVWCGVCHFNLLLVQYVLLAASIYSDFALPGVQRLCSTMECFVAPLWGYY